MHFKTVDEKKSAAHSVKEISLLFQIAVGMNERDFFYYRIPLLGDVGVAGSISCHKLH